MELRPLLLSAILLAVTMSGCAGVEPVPGEGADEEPVQAVDDNATAEPIFVMNQLPNVTFEASTFEAAIPFTVNFTIDAVDADNDTMWWNLELGNETIADGEAFPAAANYTLIEAGNHTFRLIVNDGNNETVQEITVLAIDVFTVPEPIVFTGSAMIPDPYYAATGFECVGSIFSNGSSGASHDFNIAVSGSWIYHLDADGFTTLWTGPDSYQETDGGVLGVVPANTNRVYTCSESAVEVDYTMTFYHPLHSGDLSLRCGMAQRPPTLRDANVAPVSNGLGDEPQQGSCKGPRATHVPECAHGCGAAVGLAFANPQKAHRTGFQTRGIQMGLQAGGSRIALAQAGLDPLGAACAKFTLAVKNQQPHRPVRRSALFNPSPMHVKCHAELK